ncbi:50S ribosomal protein L6 [Candidatus Desantisbacteria bacterium CG1_02_38_46]|uniref:50S ribosomal protein L6 n=3 Tax=unclassified Candidatus Desantisiibacteriota TaxID=3106372 RepID=A0A2H9PCK2_9BACT|nr:ribosomal protein L6 [uncultured bacterium]OIN97479.1 MAG: 50S ribosomal protein L6 [Candidatus Desantisbacteria bacterium CG1_02_38_46]PIU51328.1 MAG: 50S ribosomal protein L6 [Candidatus Desantisbacteria bacterium CG07_land_8_20_14_0_80_39_15]PIZ16952.1 MAG: 50S ribosomal protein L6 [Candidatus Desantisbacteria bacterium CG_4_10_14_0_8_um_filter_39_17]
MSRLGSSPIIVPDGVQVEIQDSLISAEGPVGKIKKILPAGVKVTLSDNQILVKRLTDTKLDKSLHGLIHKLIKNMLEGVLMGFEKKLEISGLGFRTQVDGDKLILQIGYSHPVKINIPEGIKIETKEKVITVKGADKELVGEVSSIVRSSKPAEPYKGTGIKYAGEQIKKKMGKAVGKITTG